MADSISDFITIIRNASRAKKTVCHAKYSKVHWAIAEILKSEGYIRGLAESKDQNNFKNIEITLKYVDGVPAITGLKRWSKSGCRLYYKSIDIPKVLGGLGIGILTTSRGIMQDKDARKENIGGELICTVW